VDATRLGGARYATYNHDGLTDDRIGLGRWVASDESGWDGEQLMDRVDRFLTVGSVAVDDSAAREIVSELRRRARLDQGAELKMSMFRRGNSQRTRALEALLGETDLLNGRFGVYFIDKRYMACSKLVDLLVEEVTFERGLHILEDGSARRMARILARKGAEAVGDRRFTDLLRAVVRFAAASNVGEAKMTTQEFMDIVRNARDSASRGAVKTILALASEGEDHAQALVAGRIALKHLEPLIPATTAVGRNWAERLESEIRLLTDDHRELDDQAIRRMVEGVARASDPSFALGVPEPRWQVRVFRGSSRRHPSIQLADLVAGAGLDVVRGELGAETALSEKVRPLVMAALDPFSLVPHDDPEHLVID
jgi:hypothetical protein